MLRVNWDCVCVWKLNYVLLTYANRLKLADKSLPLKLRAVCFYLWTYILAVPLFVVMLVLQPFVLLFDKYRRKAQHVVNRIWASVTISPFYQAEIIGLENLPSSDEAAVYVANHQSFLDIYTLFLLGRPFKFISKTSNFLIPLIGWSMYLTGHVPLKRLDKRSQLVRICFPIAGCAHLRQGTKDQMIPQMIKRVSNEPSKLFASSLFFLGLRSTAVV